MSFGHLEKTLNIKAMFGSRKMLRKEKKIMWKIIFFSLGDMENMMKKKYKKNIKEKIGGNFIGLLVLSSPSLVSNTLLFLKQTEPTGKYAFPIEEPSSPKVSCMGKVRSKKDRKSSVEMAMTAMEAKMVRSKSGKHKKCGLWKNLKSIFPTGCQAKPIKGVPELLKQSSPRNSFTVRAREMHTSESESEPPTMGGV